MHLVAQHCVLLKSAATEAQLFAVVARPSLAPLIAPVVLDRLRTLFAAAELVTIIEPIEASQSSHPAPSSMVRHVTN